MRMTLLLKLTRKDFARNRVVTTALAIFLVLAALLLASGLRVTGIMISSLNGLNQIAMPPDYLQMHKGQYDEASLERFVKTRDYVRNSQIVKMLNIPNANIILGRETLEKCLMDNGFIVQNSNFDFLLNMENEIASVEDGEIGVPVYYAEELGIRVGDVITLQNGHYRKDLTVSTLIRDASMNAALASSKRFLISQPDQDEISLHMGEWEFSFEFLLAPGASSAVLEQDYIDAGMPSNGVAVTGSLMMMLNNLSHGLIAFLIITISILLIMIAALCLSYIIQATMAEENNTVGELKAMGFSRKAISKLYLTKYLLLAAAAGVVAFPAAVPFGDFFSSSVVLYCGSGSSQWMKWALPLIGLLLLCLIVTLRCRQIIHRNLKSTTAELLRGETMGKKEGRYSLPASGLRYRNRTVALGELKCKWREYAVLFLVFVFSSFLILLPMNVKNTIENPSFITYMGVGKCDIRIDIPHCERLEEQKRAAVDQLRDDPEIKKYAVYRNGYVQVRNTEGDWEYLRVSSGDETAFPLQYLEGRAPSDRREIALSDMIASELGRKTGDTLSVSYRGEERSYTVSGIYQDITYGGKTAKAAVDFDDQDVEVYIIYLDVRDGVSIEEKTIGLRSMLADSKITPVSEFVSQTLGGISDSLRLVEVASIGISLLLVTLITAMILQLTTAREHSAIAIKKALGFTSRDIRIQLGIRILAIQVPAIAAGTLFANYLGEMIFGGMLSFMGASKLTLLVEPFTAFLLCPGVQLLAVFLTVIAGTGTVKRYHIRDQIME